MKTTGGKGGVFVKTGEIVSCNMLRLEGLMFRFAIIVVVLAAAPVTTYAQPQADMVRTCLAGKLSAQDRLMADRAVGGSMGVFERYLDRKRFEDLAAGK
ncbi:MAG: hypothetical protein ABL986_15970 [Vicinamibacterales bacterium]